MAALVGRATVKEIGMAYLDRGTGTMDADGVAYNKTQAIINNLVLDKVVQVRWMHIAFGSVSIALAFWIVVRIWYDSWRASKLKVELRPRFVGSHPFGKLNGS